MGEGCYNYGAGGSADINEAYNNYVDGLPWTSGGEAGMMPSPDPTPGWGSDAPNCGFGYGTVCIPYPVSGSIAPVFAPIRTCTLELEDRPLLHGIGSLLSGLNLHLFLVFTGLNGPPETIEGEHSGNLLKATMTGDSLFGHDDGSVTGPAVCAAEPMLASAVSRINNAKIAYQNLGPNSNSAMRYLLQSISYLQFLFPSWYHIPWEIVTLGGYFAPLPGLETPSVPPRVPRGGGVVWR